MTDTIETNSRSKRLKALTHDTHDSLDRAIVAREPFKDLGRYARFLAVQHGFHREIHALYDDPGLEVLLPDLVDRRRLGLIVLDLEDLGVGVPTWRNAPRFVHGAIDLPEALGWLYVAEGSNLGAAFLFKWAGALKLHARHGARHLAAAPEGRANQWRAFTSVLDEILMTEAEEERLTAGARAAFLHVHGLVSDVFDKG